MPKLIYSINKLKHTVEKAVVQFVAEQGVNVSIKTESLVTKDKEIGFLKDREPLLDVKTDISIKTDFE